MTAKVSFSDELVDANYHLVQYVMCRIFVSVAYSCNIIILPCLILERQAEGHGCRRSKYWGLVAATVTN